MQVYRYTLVDIETLETFMSTELDEPDPSIDMEFWYSFNTGNYAMIFLGVFEEEEV